MEPRRARRIASARRRPGRANLPSASGRAREAPRGPRRWSGAFALVALVALVAAVPLLRAFRPRPPSAEPQAPLRGTGGGTAAVPWQVLAAVGGGVPVARSLASGPHGSPWLVVSLPSGRAYLVAPGRHGAAGPWRLGAGTLSAPPWRIQTVGPRHVWLAAGRRELGFDKAHPRFQAYQASPAAAAATIAGDSAGLYLPPGAPPYALLASLGAGTARRVALPGAAPDATSPPVGAVIAGPAGTALVLVGRSVWALSVPRRQASAWGRLPAGALPQGTAWGDGRLWFATSGGVEEMVPGGRVHSLAASRAHPPVGALVYTGGRLWWAGAHAAYAYTPTGGRLRTTPYPVQGTGLLSPDTGGGVWLAVGDRLVDLRPRTGG